MSAPHETTPSIRMTADPDIEENLSRTAKAKIAEGFTAELVESVERSAGSGT